MSMQNCQPIREHQFEFGSNLGKRGIPKLRERSKQQGAPRILTEVNFFCIYDFLCLSFTNTIFQSYNNKNKEQEKSFFN